MTDAASAFAVAPAAPSRRAADRSAVAWAAGAMSFALIGLFLAFPLGLGGDYPNHLARTFVEADLGGSPALARSYEVRWTTPIPDLLMDLTVPALSRFFGIYGAGGLVAGLALALPALGGLLISRTLHGRARPAALIGFAGVFCLPAAYGFVNFVGATGLALIAFAVWIGRPPGPRRTVAFAVAGLGIAVAHALGLFLFGYLAAAFEAGRILRAGRGERGAATLAAAGRGLAFLPGLGFVGASALTSPDLDKAAPFSWGAGDRLMAVLSPTLFEPSGTGAALGGLALLVFAGALGLGLARGVLRFDPRMGAVAGALLPLVLLAPVSALGIWGLHFRFGPALVVLLAASVGAAPGRGRAARPLGAACLLAAAPLPVLGALNVARTDAAFDETRAALAALPVGARVLPVLDRDAGFVVGAHAVSLAVVERSAYVPNLFTNTSPVGVRPALRHRHRPGAQTTPAEASAAKGRPPPGPAAFHSEAFRDGWPSFFTHVAYVRGAPTRGIADEALEEVAASDALVVYRVRPDG